MNYKEMLVNVRKEIICGIENKLAQIEEGTSLIFNDSVESTTFIDKVCGETYHLNGVGKNYDGDIFIFSDDSYDEFDFDDINTEDLGEILDKLNSTSYEYDHMN